MRLPRRTFLKTALAASATAMLPRLNATPDPAVAAPTERDYFELRAYRLKPGAPQAPLDKYLEKALIPALNQRGVEAVGVFAEPDAKDGPALWVLIPHPSLESVAQVTAALNFDPAVQAAGADYLHAPKASPAFERLDSWLLLAFAGMPRLAVPARAHDRQPRIFELRIYESFSELTALKKVEMFNSGEIELMQQLNLSPVFYGQALVGRDLPQLAYLLCSPDRATHQKNWSAFGQHPVWLSLKNDPQYADTVSKVTSRFLVPAPYSQI